MFSFSPLCFTVFSCAAVCSAELYCVPMCCTLPCALHWVELSTVFYWVILYKSVLHGFSAFTAVILIYGSPVGIRKKGHTGTSVEKHLLIACLSLVFSTCLCLPGRQRQLRAEDYERTTSSLWLEFAADIATVFNSEVTY